jgi:nucleotidyltransferase/DNA polymerase involved in DNA repair
MRSFYASCAAADLGLDVMEEAIAIIGYLEQKSSIVLAASSRMKKEFGVKTGIYSVRRNRGANLLWKRANNGFMDKIRLVARKCRLA